MTIFNFISNYQKFRHSIFIHSILPNRTGPPFLARKDTKKSKALKTTFIGRTIRGRLVEGRPKGKAEALVDGFHSTAKLKIPRKCVATRRLIRTSVAATQRPAVETNSNKATRQRSNFITPFPSIGRPTKTGYPPYSRSG